VQHTYIHTGDKPYSCSTCSRSFRQRSSLVGHIRTHSKDKSSASEKLHNNSLIGHYAQ
jgi:uncharacterized Zn-finger protein